MYFKIESDQPKTTLDNTDFLKSFRAILGRPL